MNCPICAVPLQMTDRSGVEIDYCPQCRGVWLDRGELDKVIERSEQAAQPAARAPQHHVPQYREEPPRHQTPHYKKRKESFLGDLFDF